MLKRLEPELKKIGLFGGKLGLRTYLVGGAVRDKLLGRKNFDWDVVVEGDPAPLVGKLAEAWRGKITAHPKFGTFVLDLPDGRHIDFAASRKETYPLPGSLPEVKFSDLKNDLYRRDFTVNAIALSINPDSAGELIDRFGGLKDLNNRVLRVIHNESFRDDPTRILRLARFAGRGFGIEKNTLKMVFSGKKYIRRVSDERVREEILAILSEKNPSKSLKLLSDWGVLEAVLPGLKFNSRLGGKLKRGSLAERLNTLLSGAGAERFTALMAKLKLPRNLKKEIEEVRRPSAKIKPLLRGSDLLELGYKPGPMFKTILETVAARAFKSRRQAVRYVIDKFPQKV